MQEEFLVFRGLLTDLTDITDLTDAANDGERREITGVFAWHFSSAPVCTLLSVRSVPSVRFVNRGRAIPFSDIIPIQVEPGETGEEIEQFAGIDPD